jgi:hypothetical protein
MTSDKVAAAISLPKFNNSSDPRQRLDTMIFVCKNLPIGRKYRPKKSARNSTKKSTNDIVTERYSRRIVARFARQVKTACAAFGLDPANDYDRAILLGCLSWVFFGKTARRGRHRSEDRILEDIGKKIAPVLARNPAISDTELGKILRREPTELRKPDTLRKLASKARARQSRSIST